MHIYPKHREGNDWELRASYWLDHRWWRYADSGETLYLWIQIDVIDLLVVCHLRWIEHVKASFHINGGVWSNYFVMWYVIISDYEELSLFFGWKCKIYLHGYNL